MRAVLVGGAACKVPESQQSEPGGGGGETNTIQVPRRSRPSPGRRADRPFIVDSDEEVEYYDDDDDDDDE